MGQQEGEEWLQWTSEVFEAAPDWMVRLQVESVWAPVLGLNMKTRDSSVCVSFEQSGSTRRELESQGLGRDVRSVEDMCASVRVMANQIQDRCWAGKKPFTEEELHVAWAVRPDGGTEGTLTLKMRPDVQLHEDILVIGNSMSHGQGEFLRWCPVFSELGVSSCEVTQITARRGNQLPNRKQILFGHQRKGVRGWDLSNGRDSRLRQMARVLVQKSDESTKLFERLSAKNRKDWSTTQRAKAWMRYWQRAAALDCVLTGMEDGIQHQTQTTDTIRDSKTWMRRSSIRRH